MRDYFPLAYIGMVRQLFPKRIVWDHLRLAGKSINFVPNFPDTTGSDFLGTEEFKEYCRRNVDLWREERNLL